MDDGSGSPYKVSSEARDWFSFIGNIAMGATLASYFGSGLFGSKKIKDLFIEELGDAFDLDNLTEEDERNRGKSILLLEDTYEKPFAIVASRLFN